MKNTLMNKVYAALDSTSKIFGLGKGTTNAEHTMSSISTSVLEVALRYKSVLIFLQNMSPECI